MMLHFHPTCRIDSLPLALTQPVSVDVLRLDLLHPVVSGNKWFKLKHYMEAATPSQKVVVTFGGAFSNHIVATAAATRAAGLKSIGIIRGEVAPVLSPTLLQAKQFGMELIFTSRESYKEKKIPISISEQYSPERLCIIPEGGYGPWGVEGVKDILLQNHTSAYTHILSAVGTGTTLAGLTAVAGKEQKIIGISVLKNNFALQEEINRLLPPEKQDGFTLLHDYHFGGYAKRTAELIRFMNDFFKQTGIPTDFVYTAKTFFAAWDLLKKDFFGAGAKVLLVHTGGLQGNRSLPKGTLIFG